MLKIILSGACGKMGRVIAEAVKNDSNCEIIAGVDISCGDGLDFPVYQNFSALPKADVIIDFSHPSVLDNLLNFAISNNIPTVVATTGFNDSEIEKIKAAANQIPLFFTFNMSLGVNLLVSLAKKATEVLGDSFDIEIIEKHHNQKIDAPSGTAIMLANAINEQMENGMIYEYDRHSKRQKRAKNEIGMHSVRGGTIVGEHEVIFAGDNEVVSLKHQAFSKNVFAFGAIKAAKFLADKPIGIYDMNDVITQ